MIFRLGTEEGLSATDALVNARRFGFLVFTREGRLGALFAGDMILIVGEVRTPFRVAFLYFVGHIFSAMEIGYTAGEHFQMGEFMFRAGT